MKTHVLVLVPYEVTGTELSDAVAHILEAHREVETEGALKRGKFDYLVGAFEKSLNDPIAEGRLPITERMEWSGNVCDKHRVPRDLVPGALVTLDGKWHDLFDFGWRMAGESSSANEAAFARWTVQYQALLAAAPDCWVVELWAHS